MTRENLLPIVYQEKEGDPFVVRLDGIRQEYETQGEAMRFAQYYLLRHDIEHIDNIYYVKTSKHGSEKTAFVSRKDAVDFTLKRNVRERNMVI